MPLEALRFVSFSAPHDQSRKSHCPGLDSNQPHPAPFRPLLRTQCRRSQYLGEGDGGGGQSPRCTGFRAGGGWNRRGENWYNEDFPNQPPFLPIETPQIDRTRYAAPGNMISKEPQNLPGPLRASESHCYLPIVVERRRLSMYPPADAPSCISIVGQYASQRDHPLR